MNIQLYFTFLLVTSDRSHYENVPFWRLLEHSESYSMVAEELGLYSNQAKDMPRSYSVSTIKEKFRCAIIDQQLYGILHDAASRNKLEDLLTAKYLTYDSPKDKKKLFSIALGASLFFVA